MRKWAVRSRSWCGRLAWLLPVLALSWGCSEDVHAPTLTSVTPSEVSTLVTTRLKLTGARLYDAVRVDLGSTDRPAVNRGWRIRVGDAFETADVEHSDTTTLSFTLEKGALASGKYDLTAISPLGAAARLAGALTVGGVTLQIESAADNSGKVIDDRDVALGDSLVLHAVFRDPHGKWVSGSESVSWRVDPESGALSDTEAPSTRFTASAAASGVSTISAAAASGAVARVRLRVPAPEQPDAGSDAAVTAPTDAGMDAAMTDDERVLSIESAAGGSGHAIGDISGLTTDVSVTFYAVLRDHEGKFLENVDVTWSVSGGIAEAGVAGSSLKLALQKPGEGRVSAVYQKQTATTGLLHVTAGRAKTLTISPSTWSTSVGAEPQAFSTRGYDAHGNETSDLGRLSYSIASGPIGAIDPDTGVFTPSIAGDGRVAVDSDRGVHAETELLHIAAFAPPVTLTVHAPTRVTSRQLAAKLTVDVRNDGTRDVMLTGTAFSLTVGVADSATNYVIRPDYQNTDRVAAGTTLTLVYYLDVLSSALTGTLGIDATIQIYHPTAGMFASSGAATTQVSVLGVLTPSVAITAPVPPNNRVCAGEKVTFGSNNSGLLASYQATWTLPGGTPATFTDNSTSASDDAPQITYASTGTYPYSITTIATLAGVQTFQTTILSTNPVFVGQRAVLPADAYPTGAIVFASPVSNANLNMQALPTISLAQDLRQCGGAPVDLVGDRYVTLLVDRGQLDPAEDDRPAIPGIQIALDDNGRFNNVSLRAPADKLAGPAMLYAEYFRPALGKVTAAGYTMFNLTDDTQPPSVVASMPTVDCGASCLANGDVLAFRFSEPMNVSSLNNVKVERVPNCMGSATSNITSGSALSYDAESRTLYVKPTIAQNQSYFARVTLPATVKDTAGNALPAITRCAGLTPAAAAPSVASMPVVHSLSADSLSPDADGIHDSVSFDIGVDDATRILQLRILRADKVVWGQTVFVTGASDVAISWDGRDSTGRIVPNAIYRYEVHARNSAASASPVVSGIVEVTSAVHWAFAPRSY